MRKLPTRAQNKALRDKKRERSIARSKAMVKRIAQAQRDKENAPAHAGAPEWEERLISDKNGDLMHAVANAITILRHSITPRRGIRA